ncbi:DUF5518 domain-containing protein [Methanobrevibacter sp.]|uniref:DUF5518 domain-containing protein n=1 Tax=Methanobrevibacter sp. TaxID=66852 RepID=UPI0025F9BFCD|nr:DUF5518 domain-containing protein [Methanobrevibacter sp.]MEE0024105.1 DUF5518 domain-containing protein [Methanobrevibacter sp.]
MTKWSAVITGFILTICVQAFFGRYEFIGLLIVGFIVGYMAHSGAFGGMWNAAVAGAFGTILCAVVFIITATVGGSMAGIAGGLTGFTVSGAVSLIDVAMELIYYAIVMGITGAFGGLLSSKRN